MRLKSFILAGFLQLLAGFVYADITGVITQPAGVNGSIQFNKKNSFGFDPSFSYSTQTKNISVSTVTLGYGIVWPNGFVQTSSFSFSGSNSPGGSNGNVQYNNNGSFAGNSAFNILGSSPTLITNSGAGGYKSYFNGFIISDNSASIFTAGYSAFGTPSDRWKMYVQSASGVTGGQSLGGISDTSNNSIMGFGINATAVGNTPFLSATNLELSGYQNLRSSFTTISGTVPDKAIVFLASVSIPVTITLPDVDEYYALGGVYSPVRSDRVLTVCKIDSSTNTVSFSPTTSDGDRLNLVPLPLKYQNECQGFQGIYVLKSGIGSPLSYWAGTGRSAGRSISLSTATFSQVSFADGTSMTTAASGSGSGSAGGVTNSVQLRSSTGAFIGYSSFTFNATDGNLNTPIVTVGTNTTTTYNGMIQDADGDYWILANASYTASTGKFTRIDVNRAAWGLEMQGKGLFPGEVESGWVVWRATAVVYGTKEISTTFGAVGGWELGFDVTANRDLVVGGGSIEMDGFGSFPYGRFIHRTNGGTTSTGFGRNLYNDFTEHDSSLYPDWFAGFIDDEFVIERSSIQVVPNFQRLLVASTGTITNVTSGTVALNQLKFGDGTIQTTASAGSGGGFSVYPATNTAYLTNGLVASTVTINNSSTQKAIYVNQTGNADISYYNGAKGGALVIDKNSIASTDGLVVISSQATQASIDSLVHLVSQTTSYNEIMLWIQSNSTSTIGANADIRIDANNPDIEFEERDKQVSGTGLGKWEIAVNNDELQWNQRNSGDTSYQNLLGLRRDGTFAWKELSGNNSYVGFIATQTLSSSFIYKLPSDNPDDGASLHTHAYNNGYYDMYWIKDIQNTNTLQTGSTFFTYAGRITTALGGGSTSFIVTQNDTSAQAIRVISTGTANAVYIEDDGNSGNGSGSSGSMFINNSFNPGVGLQIYSNNSAPTATNGLVLFKYANTGATMPLLRLDNSGTGNSIKLVEGGNKGTSLSSSGSIFLDNSLNPGIGLQIYTTTQTATGALIHLYAATSTYATPLMVLESSSTSSNPITLRLKGPNPGIESIETDQTTPAGKYTEGINSDIHYIAGRNSTDNGYTTFIKFTRPGQSENAAQSVFTVNDSTGRILVSVDRAGHFITQSTQPVLSSCGTGPTLSGNSNDHSGTVTVGAAASGCTVTFGNAYASAPSCVVSERTMSLTNALSYTTSTSALTLTETTFGGVVFDYMCEGH